MAMTRYRITRTEGDGEQKTWVLLPDEESAVTQARERHSREKTEYLRVFREEPGAEPTLVLDLPPRA